MEGEPPSCGVGLQVVDWNLTKGSWVLEKSEKSMGNGKAMIRGEPSGAAHLVKSIPK